MESGGAMLLVDKAFVGTAGFECADFSFPRYQRAFFIQLIYSCFSRCHVPTNSVDPPLS